MTLVLSPSLPGLLPWFLQLLHVVVSSAVVGFKSWLGSPTELQNFFVKGQLLFLKHLQTAVLGAPQKEGLLSALVSVGGLTVNEFVKFYASEV